MKIFCRYIKFIISISFLSSTFIYGQSKASGSINISLRIVDANSITILDENSNQNKTVDFNNEQSELPSREILVKFNNRLTIQNKSKMISKLHYTSRVSSIKISTIFNNSISLDLDSEIDLKKINKKERINILYNNLYSAQDDGLEPSITLVF